MLFASHVRQKCSLLFGKLITQETVISLNTMFSAFYGRDIPVQNELVSIKAKDD